MFPVWRRRGGEKNQSTQWRGKSAGGIGKAIAKKFVEEGAVVVLNDMNAERLKGAGDEFKGKFGKDAYTTALLDVTKSEQINNAIA